MSDSIRRISSVFILLSILAYGMFKEYAKEFFTRISGYIVDIETINSFLNKLSLRSDWDEFAVGFLIYYPTYLLLHILFIYVLFYNRIKIRNWLIIGLTVFVIIDIGLIIVFKELNFYLLYKICYTLFQQLFGLPFILLVIEGGRHLFKEILYSD
jgi:hypothetical protein